ncbi:alpha/beta fold hydrolase [Reyranella sp. CPCC 100927]|uniref:alpha/beta hydrolase n=1 Tax=Reyranella sp. CPCC 100927 TaxID=2599616 RepID=UPI0011B3D1CE|nr:alpha/beta hydrolase [Reyranella sp. CPCC 100927]TWT13870.1 alpha/beta hydrolase [Reyranella sp. CPCC 100927]
MSVLDVPGAQIYYETRGEGPLLLLIPGANGDGNVFPPLADRLAGHYRVVTYDRRGFTRSVLSGPQDYARRLAIDADDAMRLIRRLSDGPATVFGTSSGAVIALQLLIDHPDCIRAVVPYEPAAMRLLPQGQAWIAFFREVYDLYRQSGPAPALDVFRRKTFAPIDYAIMSGGANRGPDAQKIANATYWFERELREYTSVALDMAAVAAHADRVVPALGGASLGYPTAEAALALGRAIGREALMLPDGHVGYATSPEAFARGLMDRLSAEGGT